MSAPVARAMKLTINVDPAGRWCGSVAAETGDTVETLESGAHALEALLARLDRRAPVEHDPELAAILVEDITQCPAEAKAYYVDLAQGAGYSEAEIARELSHLAKDKTVYCSYGRWYPKGYVRGSVKP